MVAYGIFCSFQINGSSPYFCRSFCHRCCVAWKKQTQSAQILLFYRADFLKCRCKDFSSFHLFSWKTTVVKPLSSFLFACKSVMLFFFFSFSFNCLDFFPCTCRQRTKKKTYLGKNSIRDLATVHQLLQDKSSPYL